MASRAESVIEAGNYTNLTVDTLVYTGRCDLIGIFVASASATPTIKVWDQTSAAAPILVNTFTPVAGTFYPIPAKCHNGLYVDIGGTLDITVFWNN